MIVRVGHPDVCGQIGHGRGDQSDSDSLRRWSLKLQFFVRTFPPAVTASRAQAKTCLVEVVRPCPVQAPLVEQKGNFHDEALGQYHLVKQSPHLGAASLCCSLKAQINADQEGTHPFTRQFNIQTVLLAKVLEEGTHDLGRHTRTLTKHVMRQDCQLLSHSPSGLLGPSTTPSRAIQYPSVHGVCVHIAEDLRAPPLTVHEHVFLLPAVHMKSVGQAQEPLNVMSGHTCPLFLVLVFLDDCMSSTSKYLLNISDNAHASLPR